MGGEAVGGLSNGLVHASLVSMSTSSSDVDGIIRHTLQSFYDV